MKPSLRLIAIVALFGLANVLYAQNEPEWSQAGRSLYQANCSGCHHTEGTGVPGMFPPLAGHIPVLLGYADGDTLLIKTMLYGLAGPIEVLGAAYDGAMPAWSMKSDEEIAAMLNYIANAWENEAALPEGFEAFTAEMVAAQRNLNLTANDVLAYRATVLGLATVPANSGSMMVLDDTTGYYTIAQAARGQAHYNRYCASCHGPTMRGGPHAPTLNQVGFFRTWRDRSLDTLTQYIQAEMPLASKGSLSLRVVSEIVAHWLATVGYPAGDVELPTTLSEQRSITIVRR